MSNRRMWARMLLGWPLPRATYPLAGIVVAVAVVAVTRPLTSAPYVTWPSVSAAWHESLVWPVALAAGVSAWVGASLFPRRSPLSLAVRPRLGAPAVAAHLAGLVSWTVLGLVVGMAPLTVHAITTASWGHLRVSDVVVAVLGLASIVAVAFAAGVLVRSTLAAPLVALAALVVVNLVNSPELRPLALVQPVQQWTADERFVPNLAVSAFSVVAALAGTLAAVAAADALLRPRNRRNLGHLGLIAIPILLTVIAFAWRPELYVDSGLRPEACRQVDGASVCLHQAHAPALDPVADTVAALRSAGAAPLFDSVVGSALLSAGDEPSAQVVDPVPFISVSIADRTANSLSYAAQPLLACLPADHESMASWSPSIASELGELVRYRLLVDAGFPEVANRFVVRSSDVMEEWEILAAMSAEQFREFVADNAQAISTCSLTEADFVAS